MEKLSNEFIIRKLMSKSKPENEEAIVYLTKCLKVSTYSFLMKRKAKLEDAEEIFSESLTNLWELAQNGKLAEKEIDVEAYLFTICKNKWFKRFGKKDNNEDLPEEIFTNEASVEDKMIDKEREEGNKLKLEKFLNKIGSDCKKVLILFYYKNYSMEEIAQEMGYKSAIIAKNKKYTCLEKAKGFL